MSRDARLLLALAVFLEAGKSYGCFEPFFVHLRSRNDSRIVSSATWRGGDEPEVRRLFDWDVRGFSNWTNSITSSVWVISNQENSHD